MPFSPLQASEAEQETAFEEVHERRKEAGASRGEPKESTPLTRRSTEGGTLSSISTETPSHWGVADPPPAPPPSDSVEGGIKISGPGQLVEAKLPPKLKVSGSTFAGDAVDLSIRQFPSFTTPSQSIPIQNDTETPSAF